MCAEARVRNGFFPTYFFPKLGISQIYLFTRAVETHALGLGNLCLRFIRAIAHQYGIGNECFSARRDVFAHAYLFDAVLLMNLRNLKFS